MNEKFKELEEPTPKINISGKNSAEDKDEETKSKSGFASRETSMVKDGRASDDVSFSKTASKQTLMSEIMKGSDLLKHESSDEGDVE